MQTAAGHSPDRQAGRLQSVTVSETKVTEHVPSLNLADQDEALVLQALAHAGLSGGVHCTPPRPLSVPRIRSQHNAGDKGSNSNTYIKM